MDGLGHTKHFTLVGSVAKSFPRCLGSIELARTDTPAGTQEMRADGWGKRMRRDGWLMLPFCLGKEGRRLVALGENTARFHWIPLVCSGQSLILEPSDHATTSPAVACLKKVDFDTRRLMT